MGSNMMIRFPGIPLSFENVPRSFKILGFEITVFGLLLAAALVISLIIITTVAKRRGISPNQCLGGAFFAVIGGIVGSRALYVGVSLSEYGMNWDTMDWSNIDWMRILNTRDGGMTFFGAIAGSMLFLGLFSLISRSSFLVNADVIAIGGCFCQAVVRWGDFFNREAFGEYTDLPFAMQLPQESVHARYVTDLMREHLTEEGGTAFIQVIPLFLFESVVFLILFFILTARNRRKIFAGETFYRYLTWCGFISLPIRFLRTDKLPVPGMEPMKILGIEVDLNLIIAAFMFVFFGLVLSIRRSMARKRSDVRREHNERIYQQEEQAEAAADRWEKELEEQRNDLNRRTEEIRQARYRAEEENRSRVRQPDRRGATSVEEILAEAEALRAEADSLTAKAEALSAEKEAKEASSRKNRQTSGRWGRRSSGKADSSRQTSFDVNHPSSAGSNESLSSAGTNESLSSAGTNESLSSTGTNEPLPSAGTNESLSSAGSNESLSSSDQAGQSSSSGSVQQSVNIAADGEKIPEGSASQDPVYPWSKWETEETRRAPGSLSDSYQTMFTDNQTMEEAEKGVTLDPTMKIDVD